MVGASCIAATAQTDYIRAQSCAVFAVVVCCTHLTAYAFIAYTTSTTEPRACVAVFTAEIANLNVVLSTAVTKGYEFFVSSAGAASLTFIADSAEVITAGTRLVTPSADSYAVLAGRTFFTEYIVVVSAL